MTDSIAYITQLEGQLKRLQAENERLLKEISMQKSMREMAEVRYGDQIKDYYEENEMLKYQVSKLKIIEKVYSDALPFLAVHGYGGVRFVGDTPTLRSY